MNEKTINKVNSEAEMAGQIKGALYMMQEQFNSLSKLADQSYALHKIGKTTKLTNAIKESLTNPFKSMCDFSESIDNNIKNVINETIIKSLASHKDLIQKVVRLKTDFDELQYGVVLKDDTFENRNVIFEITDNYDLLEVSSKFPVHIQFIPIELLRNVFVKEEIAIENN